MNSYEELYSLFYNLFFKANAKLLEAIEEDYELVTSSQGLEYEPRQELLTLDFEAYMQYTDAMIDYLFDTY